MITYHDGKQTNQSTSITAKLSKHVDVTLKYTYSGRNIHLSECSVRSPRFLKFTYTHQKKKFYATKTNGDVIAHVTDMSEEKKKYLHSRWLRTQNDFVCF